MDYKKITKYIIAAKKLLVMRQKNGNVDTPETKDLTQEMEKIWNALTDEETLMVDHIFKFELITRDITGEWMDNEWFLPEKE